MEDGRFACSIKSDQYVKVTVKTVKILLAKNCKELKSGKRSHKGSLPHGYKPKLYTKEKCEPELTSRYQ